MQVFATTAGDETSSSKAILTYAVAVVYSSSYAHECRQSYGLGSRSTPTRPSLRQLFPPSYGDLQLRMLSHYYLKGILQVCRDL